MARGVRVHPRLTRDPRARRARGSRRPPSWRCSRSSRSCCRAFPAAVRGTAESGFALDAYSSIDPSFRIARDMLESGTTGDAATSTRISGRTRRRGRTSSRRHRFRARLDALDRTAAEIFLFIIDSLRRLCAQRRRAAHAGHPRVHDDSLVFRRFALCRDGSVGAGDLAGAMVIRRNM